MNLNVIVLNVGHDFRSTAPDRGRDRDDRLGRSFPHPYANHAGEVIELVAQDGAWVENDGAGAAKTAAFARTRDRNALYASSATANPTATYDHEGRVRHSAQEKGLLINITA